jgi:uncharacterized membrane protein YjgN (DUF898 family)
MSGPYPYDSGSQPPPQDRIDPPYGTGYPYGNYGYAAGYAREHPQGTAILVLGIVSIVACGLTGPFAWTMGNNAMRDVDQYPYAYTNRSNIQAGRILGIVGTGLLVLQLLSVVGFFVLLAVGSLAGA